MILTSFWNRKVCNIVIRCRTYIWFYKTNNLYKWKPHTLDSPKILEAKWIRDNVNRS